MVGPLLARLQSLGDPLRSSAAAERWLAWRRAVDAAGVLRKTLELVNGFAAGAIEPRRIEALLSVDLALEPSIAELTRQYAAGYSRSTETELRSWQAVFDLVKSFTGAYQCVLEEGYARAGEAAWRAVLPRVLARLAWHKGLDGKFRLFRFSRWSAPQWRECHAPYEFARARGWHREPLAFGARSAAGAEGKGKGTCIEREYLKTLLLMYLDFGSFTADQVEWIASRLDEWSSTLELLPRPSARTGFFVDLGTPEGLRRTSELRGGRVLFLDTSPLHDRVVGQAACLTDDQSIEQGDLPVRERRLLLTRLALLFCPQAPAAAPRAARSVVDSEVRVVAGFQAVCAAIRETEKFHTDSTDDATIEREVADIAATMMGSDSLPRRIAGTTCRMVDSSASGCRLVFTGDDMALRPGDLLGIDSEGAWSIGVVRRMLRDDNDTLTIGVEIIARRFVRVLLRIHPPADAAARAEDQPFLAIYAPKHADNRRPDERTLIGPERRLVTGAMLELETYTARYLIRLAARLGGHHGWIWSSFKAIRRAS